MCRIQVKLAVAQAESLRRLFRNTTSRIEALRCRIILLLNEGRSAREVSAMTGCVRATVYRTVYRFEDAGQVGLLDQRKLRGPTKANEEVREKLLDYVDKCPADFGWQRNTWTLELFALQLLADTGIQFSPRHVRNILHRCGCRRGRPCPALRIPVRGRRAILDHVEQTVRDASCEHEVFYVDEVDVDLNPRIGFTYLRRGHQLRVLTPGKNVKRYVAAALNARTGAITYVTGRRKDSMLFLALTRALNARYRRAESIAFVLDNYIIHKSKLTRDTLATQYPRVKRVFLPPYSPEHNRIEPLFKQMHDHVTRNHRYKTIDELMNAVTTFFDQAQPFPGTKVSTRRSVA